MTDIICGHGHIIQNLGLDARACVYKTPIGDVSELRQCLIDCWSSLSQDIIDDAIDQWQVQLRACVKAKGRHFEHRLH